jgi:hypothetical protein
VDKFQGQQNDFILPSLVRTRFVGHLRGVRRLIVAMSRARLGLYVFCRRSLFEQCYELQPTFKLLLQRPDKLALNLEDCTPFTERPLEETAKDDIMQEGNMTGQGNAKGDMATEDTKGEEHANAKEKMEEDNALLKDEMDEENAESKDKMVEE